MSNTGQYDSVMHVIADKLLEHFDLTGAINYLEQTFESKDDPSKSFVLTMQMREGLTPCEKLATAEQRIAELEGLIQAANDRISILEGDVKYMTQECEKAKNRNYDDYSTLRQLDELVNYRYIILTAKD